jgi:hypothetical protein
VAFFLLVKGGALERTDELGADVPEPAEVAVHLGEFAVQDGHRGRAGVSRRIARAQAVEEGPGVVQAEADGQQRPISVTRRRSSSPYSR